MSKYHKNLWKMDPGAQQKTMLKNRPPKNEKCSKNDSQLGPKKWVYFRGFASWGTFGGPIHFLTLKVGPQRSQSASNDRKLTQKWYQRAPRLRKRAPKDKPFRALRNIMKQKNAMTQHTRFYDYEKSSPADCAKSDTEGPQKIKKRFQMCICWGTWPGGLREALSIILGFIPLFFATSDLTKPQKH